MGVQVKHFQELGVTLNIYSGPITREVLLRRIEEMRADIDRWVTYFDPSATGLVDVSSVPEVRGAFKAKIKELYGERRIRCAMVADPGTQDMLLRFWPTYFVADGQNTTPSGAFTSLENVGAFTSLESASDWLNLPEGASKVLTDAVESFRAGG